MSDLQQSKKSEYRFDVAISFAGDNKRDKLRNVAKILQKRLGKKKVFFDEFFTEEIAGTNAVKYLQNIYRNESCLVVSCVCKRYDEKPWTQAEWRAIQARNADCEQSPESRLQFLPLRFGDGEVDGLFSSLDMIPEMQESNPKEIAKFILKRLELVREQAAKTSDQGNNDESRVNKKSTKKRYWITSLLTLTILVFAGVAYSWIGGAESREIKRLEKLKAREVAHRKEKEALAMSRLKQKGWEITPRSDDKGVYRIGHKKDEDGRIISISFDECVHDIVSLDPQRLDLSPCKLSGLSLAPLKNLTNLERLSVNGTGCRCVDLAELAEHLKSLIALDAGDCSLESLNFLDSLPILETLRINNSEKNDCLIFSLDKAASHKKLKHLELQHCKIFQVDLENHPTLETIQLKDCPVNDLRIKDLNSLRKIIISNANLAENSNKNYRLENLRDLQNLELVMISSLESVIISKTPNLESVTISSNDQLTNVVFHDIDSLNGGEIMFGDNSRLENVYFVKIQQFFVKQNKFEFKTNGVKNKSKTVFWVENDEVKKRLTGLEPANGIEDIDYEVMVLTPEAMNNANELKSSNPGGSNPGGDK